MKNNNQGSNQLTRVYVEKWLLKRHMHVTLTLQLLTQLRLQQTDNSPIGIIGPMDIGTGGIPGIIGMGTKPGGGIPAEAVVA